MKTDFKCIACFTGQLMSIIERLNAPHEKKVYYVSEILKIISEIDYSFPAPVAAKKMYSAISEITGNSDPFREIKINSNLLGKKIVQDIDISLSSSQMNEHEKFIAVVKYLISANIIDYGAHSALTEEIILNEMRNLNDDNIDLSSVMSFKNDIEKAVKILYIGDNAGEVQMDAYFIENYLSSKAVTFCVRGYPVINDITEEDAYSAGINRFADIINTGDNTPGIDITCMPDKLVSAFAESDLIIMKGQGNFETIGETGIQSQISGIYNITINAPIYSLFKVKCPHVANYVQKAIGTMSILRFF